MDLRSTLPYNKLWIFSFVLTALQVAGCGGGGKMLVEHIDQLEDARLSDALRMNLTATGGMDAWLEMQRVHAEAVGTVTDADGGKSLVDQHHELSLLVPYALDIASTSSDGIWLERYDAQGNVTLNLQGSEAVLDLDADVQQGTALKLRLMIQALTQSAGLLHPNWRLRYVGLERKGGRLTHKIEATGSIVNPTATEEYLATGEQLVVWIDAKTLFFDRLWLRYRRGAGEDADDFGYLAANLSIYKKQPGGLVLPTQVAIVRSDKFQQFSEREIMLVEYQRFTFIRDLED